MKINFVPRTGGGCSCILGKKCTKEIIENSGQNPFITFEHKTATRIGLYLWAGETATDIGVPVDGFKTHTDTQYRVQFHYFVLSKKQGSGKFRQWVEACIIQFCEKLGVTVQELTVECPDLSGLDK